MVSAANVPTDSSPGTSKDTTLTEAHTRDSLLCNPDNTTQEELWTDVNDSEMCSNTSSNSKGSRKSRGKQSKSRSKGQRLHKRDSGVYDQQYPHLPLSPSPEDSVISEPSSVVSNIPDMIPVSARGSLDGDDEVDRLPVVSVTIRAKSVDSDSILASDDPERPASRRFTYGGYKRKHHKKSSSKKSLLQFGKPKVYSGGLV